MAAQLSLNSDEDSTTAKLVEHRVDGSSHHTITCDLSLNLMDPDLDEILALVKVPLVGQWELEIAREKEEIRISVRHDHLPVGVWGPRVRIAYTFSYTLGGQQMLLKRSTWSWNPRPSASSKMDGMSISRFGSRLVFTIESAEAEPTLEAANLIKHLPALDLSATRHNVRLFFPRQDADLWAESALLTRSSPYFKTLLSSDFAEAVSIPSKRIRTIRSSGVATTAADAEAKDFDDSDDETDKLYFAKRPAQQSEGEELQHPYKEIQITKTAFSTYRAVLAYLRTGWIAFAPLSSTFLSDANAGAPSHRSHIEAAVSSDPSLPYPVSPKSAFRLGHLLELDDLQQLCLANLSKQLTIGSAPREVFSAVSVCYDDWRNVILDYVVKNCDAVTKSAAWVEVTGKVERDEIAGAAPIMLELFKRKVLKP